MDYTPPMPHDLMTTSYAEARLETLAAEIIAVAERWNELYRRDGSQEPSRMFKIITLKSAAKAFLAKPGKEI